MTKLHRLTKRGWQRDLRDALITRCEKIRKDVKRYRKQNPEHTRSIRDYPACVSACCIGYKGNNMYIKESGKTSRDYYNNTPLECIISRMGGVGAKTMGCKHSLGCCAEQHAARELLINETYAAINKIFFDKTARPRLNTIIKPCVYCKKIFPQ